MDSRGPDPLPGSIPRLLARPEPLIVLRPSVSSGGKQKGDKFASTSLSELPSPSSLQKSLRRGENQSGSLALALLGVGDYLFSVKHWLLAADRYFDLLRLGLGALCQPHRQNTVVVVSGGLFGTYRVRQRE